MSSVSAYKRTEIIGQGKFGVVYKGYHKQTKKVVAIKVLELDTKYDEVVDVQQEIQFLADLKHAPNVTHYYGSFLNDTKLWIIMDYCAGGSVRTLLKAGVFEERYVGVIFREILMALLCVHKLGVIHRDIKAANILITNEGNVQLCDFGVAAQLTANALKRTTMAGTPFWMAPEVIREGDQYNVKADIWSLGITIYEIVTGNPPYCDKGSSWAMTMIAKLTPPRLEGREYPLALKECIALCLDENPEERPSADDLLKCKLVRLYKNSPTSTLKELISRYLLWRDHNSSRDSVFMSTEEAAEDSENLIQVKWDFDSLSSREYIIENDIHLSELDEHFPYVHDDETNYTITTQPTFRMDGRDTITNTNMHPSTITGGRFNSTYSTGEKLGTGSRQGATPSAAVPKSLMSLFEEEGSPELEPYSTSNDNYDLPRVPPLSMSELPVKSPTIEIPDMDSMAKIGTALRGNQSLTHLIGAQGRLNLYVQVSLHDTFPRLNKPPTLMHSQSASAALEPRHNSPGSSRPRKKTISNTHGSTSSQLLHSDQALPISHVTPHHLASQMTRETPSPIAPPSAAALLAETSLNSSPSKSMRALHSSSNPLLQPINFKLNGESPTQLTKSASIASTPSSVSANSNASATTAATAATSSALNKSKKEKPPLRIQMPVPSSSFNLLSALTNEDLEGKGKNENVNQFGINPSLLNNVASMTPVTERDSQLGDDLELRNADHGSNGVAGQRQVPGQQKKLAPMLGPKPTPLSVVAPNTGNFFLPRNRSLSNSSSTPVNAKPVAKFPTIPAISAELFTDSTPKAKLAHELEIMLKLFNQGLDVLESTL